MTKNQNPISKDFIEKPRKIMEAYYDLMENDHDAGDILALTEEDPDYYDPYLYVADDLRKLSEEAEARRLEDEAFSRALARIKDKDGQWPDTLNWGHLENRHIVRALMTGADNLWQDGKTEEALNIYRQLLRTNLGDNIGARYAIIGLRLGLSYDDYIQEVWPEPTMPADHIDNWFSIHAPKYAEELGDWKQYCIEEIGLDEKEFPF